MIDLMAKCVSLNLVALATRNEPYGHSMDRSMLLILTNYTTSKREQWFNDTIQYNNDWESIQLLLNGSLTALKHNKSIKGQY